jgi:transcription-repair coupling factor (superfamily II helicase)
MEIRGAGELLGEDQSGQIAQIGFSLYNELLSRAVEALRDGREPDLETTRRHGAEVELHLPALIPDDYLHDVHTRLTLYKRIASARSEDELRELQVEMIDRFGLLPAPARNLFAVARLKLKADRVGITRIDVGPRGGRFEFSEQAEADVEALLELVHGDPRRFRMQGPTRLQLLEGDEDEAARIERVDALLERLAAVPA